MNIQIHRDTFFQKYYTHINDNYQVLICKIIPLFLTVNPECDMLIL